MFNIGGGEVLVILLVALIVLGPQRLPGAARQAGKVLGELRRMSSGFQTELRQAISEADGDDATARPRRAPLEAVTTAQAPEELPGDVADQVDDALADAAKPTPPGGGNAPDSGGDARAAS